jgi:hypothetical protein
VQRALKRVLAVAAMAALSSSWAVGWSAALHVGTDHHHDGDPEDHEGALGLQMVLHGHPHTEGTRAHSHAFIGNAAMPASGKLIVSVTARIGDVPEAACGEISGRRVLSRGGPTHDPPPRLEAFSVLRI